LCAGFLNSGTLLESPNVGKEKWGDRPQEVFALSKPVVCFPIHKDPP